jgi:hypothetical protein
MMVFHGKKSMVFLLHIYQNTYVTNHPSPSFPNPFQSLTKHMSIEASRDPPLPERIAISMASVGVGDGIWK